MLVAGGGASTKDARVVDFNGATPQVSATAPMAFGRRQHNLTVLADGTVLATGGNSSGAALVDLNAGVYAAEQWNPATGQWRTLAAMQVTRQYHSTALLLPDGRVLSSGGGICGTCDQVGYLGQERRDLLAALPLPGRRHARAAPAIDAAPAADELRRGDGDRDGEPGVDPQGRPRPARRGHALGQHGAALHPADLHRRRDEPHRHRAGQRQHRAAGFYMLFIIDANGVPSVARMVSVQGNSPPTRHAHAAGERRDLHRARRR